METITISDLHFLLFIVPGFMTVWSFRYFARSNKKGDFELVGLSFFWGLIILFIFSSIQSRGSIEKLLQNPYAAGMILSLFGILVGGFGCLGSKILHSKQLKKFLEKYL